MITIMVKLAPGERAQVGDQVAGGTVTVAFPGEPYVAVEKDEYQYGAFEADPRVVEHRPEKIMKPMVMPEPLVPQAMIAAPMPGDTFPMCGITDEVLKSGGWGSDVVLAVVDTGVDARHNAFAGKNVFGDLVDTQGHGTHVASTAGSGIGIASDAPIFSKRVLDGPNGEGSESTVAAGLQAVADWSMANKTNVVINMSLGGGSSNLIDAGVRYCQQRGLWVVAAAGNDGPNAVLGSPARQADFVVGAVDRNSQIASFSSGNGTWQQITCYTPGVYIAAAKAGTTDQYLVLSGTSMATPHLTGLLLLMRHAGMNLYNARDYIGVNQTNIGAVNRKGLFVIKPNYAPAVPAPPVVTPPLDVNIVEEITGIADEVQNQIEQVQEARKGVNAGNFTAKMDEIFNVHIGPIHDYMDQIKGLLPKVEDPPPPPPPPPPPVERIVQPGQTAIRNTGRNQIRVSVPMTQDTGLWTVVTFAGSGFQGAPLGAIPADFRGMAVEGFHPQTVGNQFTQNGIIYVEAAYRGGPVQGQLDDAVAAFETVLREAEGYGGSPERICLCGHSSGGWLAARLAEIHPEVKFAMLMSGAALKVNNYNWPAMTRQLLASAGVNESNSPYTALPQAQGKMTLAMVVAMQDEQIVPQSELDFANAARQAGHSVFVQQINGDHGSSINPGLSWTIQICGQN